MLRATTFFSLFLPILLCAQLPTSVDISLVPNNAAGMLDVRLRPNNASFGGVVSFIFMLRWPATSSATLGTPQSSCPGPMPVQSTNVVVNGSYRYVYVSSSGPQPLAEQGCSWNAGTWSTVCSIPVSGECATFAIVNDGYTLATNGNFWCSLNGLDRTGSIDAVNSADMCGPSSVDIRLEASSTPGMLDVSLRPAGSGFSGVLSGLIFTVRWAATLSGEPGTGTVPCPAGIAPLPTATVTNAGSRYRTYSALGTQTLAQAGCNLLADTWTIITRIPLNCTLVEGGFAIANDAFTDATNRSYFISLNGLPVNGSIISGTVVMPAVDVDPDGDGIASACDACPGIAGQPGSPCNDGDACTVNDAISALCQCVGTFQDTDGDGVCNALDACPLVNGTIGSPCNDNNVNTYADVLSAACTCVGTLGCELYARAFLEGAYDPVTGRMRDDLRDLSLLPSTEPYTALGYAFVGGGGEHAGGGVLQNNANNNAIVDWILLELRSNSAPNTVVTSRAALITKNGNIVDENGSSPVRLRAPAGTYHVVVRHRNHLGVMSQPVSLVPFASQDLDLSSLSTLTYGIQGCKVVGTSTLVQALWAGDSNFDGELRYTGAGNDRDPILVQVGSNTPNNSVNNVYSSLDVNLTGGVRYTGTGNDRDIILVNVGSTTPNNVRVQQVP